MAGDRYLVLLQPTRADVNRDSLSRHMLDFVQETCSRGNFVYLACQTTINDEVVVLPDLPPSCFRVPVEARCGDSIMQGRAVVDLVSLAKAFSRDFGRYTIDAVVSLVYAPAQAIALGLAATQSSWGPPVIRIDPGTTLSTADLTTHHMVEAGCAPNVHTVVLSNAERTEWLDAVLGCDLTFTKRAQFASNLHVSPVRLDLELLESMRQMRSTKPTLLYAGRSNSTKNPQKILNTYVDLQVAGHDCNILFMTQDDHWKKHTNFTECPQVKQCTKASRGQFYIEAARSHVFMNWSESESFHATFREAALLGNVCLSVDNAAMRDLFEGALPERFWFKDNHGAARDRLQAVLLDLPQAQKDMQPFIDWVRKQNTLPSIAERVETITKKALLDSFSTGIVEGYVLDPAQWPIFDQVMSELLARGPISMFSLNDFIVRIKELFPPLEKYASAFSPWHARNVLKFHYNLVDNCSARHPTFTVTPALKCKE